MQTRLTIPGLFDLDAVDVKLCGTRSKEKGRLPKKPARVPCRMMGERG
jgi:hypothetical protein